MSSLPAVQVHNLRKEFIRRDGGSRVRGRRRRVAALHGLTFEMKRGECVAILGQNGSGKSTLVRLLSTLLIHDGGTAHVFGIDVFAKPRAVQRLVNRVSVEASFFKKLSAMENLVYAGRLYGVPAADARARSREILVRLGIAVVRHDEPLEKLSRGMQQKVAIARAFLTSPALLLLDEPTTGLDIRSKREVQTFVRDLRDDHDATILLTTHDLDEAERLADRVGVLHEGKLVAEGTAGELASRYGARGSLEDVFMTVTGRKLEELEAEKGGGEEDGR
jgi:ABC-2 type transport system ATP-binding protein